MELFLSTMLGLIVACVVVAPGSFGVIAVVTWGVDHRWPGWVVVPLAVLVAVLWTSVLVTGAEYLR